MRVRSLKAALFTTVAAVGLSLAAPSSAKAQVSFGVNIGGPEPACPYGYYGYAPYNCSPYGYYGPQWFDGGVFRGAGPWFHGQRGFYGPVNNGYDPRYGYNGGFPGHGGYREPGDHFNNFHGNDFHGPYGEGHHEGFHGGYEQSHGGNFGGGHNDAGGHFDGGHNGGGHDGGGHDNGGHH